MSSKEVKKIFDSALERYHDESERCNKYNKIAKKIYDWMDELESAKRQTRRDMNKEEQLEANTKVHLASLMRLEEMDAEQDEKRVIEKHNKIRIKDLGMQPKGSETGGLSKTTMLVHNQAKIDDHLKDFRPQNLPL